MPVNVRSSRGAQLRLQKENGYGVAGSGAWTRLNANTVAPGTTIESEQFVPQGAFFPTISIINDDFSEGDADGVVDFNSIVFFLASWFGVPVITDLGGGAYRWVFKTDGRKPNRPVSYLLHYGFPDAADQVPGWIWNSLGIGGGRADGFQITSSGLGKKMTQGVQLGGTTNEVQTITITGSPTGGTFTLALDGQVTAPIAYNANAAAVQVALEALGTIGAGNVSATGGPLPGSGVTVTFVGDLAGQNIATLVANSASLTGGTTPTVNVATTTPGADSVADIEPVPAGAIIGDCYLNDSWATLGTTQQLHCYSNDLQLDARMNRVRPINSSLASDDLIDNPDQEHTLDLKVGVNAAERALLTALRAGQKKFSRLKWTGGQIAASGQNFLLQVDSCLLLTTVGPPEDQDGVLTRTVGSRISIDTASNPDEALTVMVQNAVGSLTPTP